MEDLETNMDIRQVFASTAVVLLVVVGVGAWLGDLNNHYGTTAGSSFNATLASVTTSITYNLSSTSVAAGGNTFNQAGAASTTQQQGLLARSLSSIQQIGAFFSLIPNLIQDGGALLGLPTALTDLAVWTFVFFLGITIAFLFLQIVSRFNF